EGRRGPDAGPGDVFPGRLLRTFLRPGPPTHSTRRPRSARVLDHHRALSARRAASHPDRARSRAVHAGGGAHAQGEAAAATDAGEVGGLGVGGGLTAGAIRGGGRPSIRVPTRLRTITPLTGTSRA